MKFIVIDKRNDDTGDMFTTECKDLNEAVNEAKRQWNYLTNREKKVRNIWVLESVNPDEDAMDHFDGDYIWDAATKRA